MSIPTRLPSVVFHTRVRGESIGGDNPYRWQLVRSEELFEGRECILFALPGAFTPTCSTYQLPDFEKLYPQFQEQGIDEIYCLSVNDSFVMNKWAKEQGLKNVKVIPDGSGKFTLQMNMMVYKDNLGFGPRSWRYAVHTKDMNIVNSWVEDNKRDDADDDPYVHSTPQNILADLMKG